MLWGRTLSKTIYRKPTYTDQYSHWGSHHNLFAGYSVFNIVTHRTRTVCFNPQLTQKDEEHLRGILQRHNHPTWALNRLKLKTPTMTTPTPPIGTRKKTTFTWYYLTLKCLVKALRTCGANRGYKYTSKEAIQSRSSWWPPRIKTQSQRKICHV